MSMYCVVVSHAVVVCLIVCEWVAGSQVAGSCRLFQRGLTLLFTFHTKTSLYMILFPCQYISEGERLMSSI